MFFGASGGIRVPRPCGETALWSFLSCGTSGRTVMYFLHEWGLPSESRDTQRWTKEQRTHSSPRKHEAEVYECLEAEAWPSPHVVRRAPEA